MKKFILPLLMLFVSAPAFSQIVRSTTFSKAETPKRSTEWFVRVGLSENNYTGPGMREAKKGLKDYKKQDYVDDAGYKARSNFDLMFGFNKYFGQTDLYWGMEFGIGTRGGAYYTETHRKVHDYSGRVELEGNVDTKSDSYVNTYGIKYVPFTLGYKFPVANDFKIDAHLGLFLEFDFAGSSVSKRKENGPGWYEGDLADDDDSESMWDLEDADGNKLIMPFDAGLQLGVGFWYKRLNLNFTWQRGFANYVHAGYNKDGDELWFQSSNAIISLGIAF